MQNSCGILFISKPTKKIGLGLRSDVNNPNTWSTIGGGIESGETILDCLKREIKEELGIELNTKLIPLDDNGFYKTFISLVNSEFNPILNNEHSEFKWFNYDELPQNLHPELKKSLNKPFVYKVLNNHLSEATTTGSVGVYVQPLGSPIFRTNIGDSINENNQIWVLNNRNYLKMNEKIVFTKKQLMEDVELGEATTDSTGSYETPKAWAKSMSKKDWRFANKPTYPGGKFMKVKEKCKKFPYCNQGDINALELWEDDDLLKNEEGILKEVVKEVSKDMDISENIIFKILEEKKSIQK